MHIQQQVSLKAYNTFGMDVAAAYFIELNDEQLPRQRYILGGGSNVLLKHDVNGLVILNRLKGIQLETEDDNHVWVKVRSGEIWHEFVMYAISHGWAGIENLALIPGTVGASPIQNIGAYGVEAKETIEAVTAWHWEEENFVTYTNEECRFAYRDSIFKHELKDKVFISSVIFRLNKKPLYNTAYGAIEHELRKLDVSEVSIKIIADAVIAIRSSKLPDPKQIGNAGSFFKNPTIPIAQFEKLQTNYPHILSYPATPGMIKIPAGWLIEQCGWKGYRVGSTGVHNQQALVLVNYGRATGEEVWQLSEEIVTSVNEKFGIILEREVQVW